MNLNELIVKRDELKAPTPVKLASKALGRHDAIQYPCAAGGGGGEFPCERDTERCICESQMFTVVLSPSEPHGLRSR